MYHRLSPYYNRNASSIQTELLVGFVSQTDRIFRLRSMYPCEHYLVFSEARKFSNKYLICQQHKGWYYGGKWLRLQRRFLVWFLRLIDEQRSCEKDQTIILPLHLHTTAPSSLRRDKAEHASLSEPLMRMNETHTRRKISHCERFTNLYNTYNSRLTVPKSICLFQQLNLKKQCRYCLVKAVRC